MPAPIPSISAFNNWRDAWRDNNAQAMIDGGLSFDQHLDNSYYDAIKVAIRMKQLTGNAAWDTYLANARTAYRDAYVIANGGGVVAWYNFCEGLTLDWQINGNATSRSAVNLLATHAAFSAVGQDQSKFTDIHYARENAYTLMGYLKNWECGNVGTIDSRASGLKDNCFTLFTKWKNSIGGLTQFYMRPFMVERVTETLFEWDRLIGLTQAERDAVRDMWEYVHTTQWRSTDAFPALNYTSVNIYTMSPTTPNTSEQADLVAQNPSPSDGMVTGIDLSNLISHVYARLYKQGYGDIWGTRFDAMFVPAIPVYDASGNWVSGAYISRNTVASIKGKHYNQQLTNWYDAKADREAGPATIQPAAGVSGYQNMTLGFGCGGGTQITNTVVTGTIADGNGTPINNVSVAMTGGSTQTVLTGSNGVFIFAAITTGTSVTLTPTLSGYTFSPANSGSFAVAGTTQLYNFLAVQAYSPANAYSASPVLRWGKAYDTNFCLDGVSAPVTNGNGCQTFKDAYSGTPKNYSQLTGASQPIVRTNTIATTKQSLEFISKTMDCTALDAAVNGLSKFTYGCVVKLISTTGNQFLYRCFENSFSFNRILISINSGSPQMSINRTDANNVADVIDNATILTTGNWHALLFVADFVANTVNLYVNNVLTKTVTSVMSSSGTLPATAAQQSRVGLSSNYNLADEHCASAAPTPSTWFSQVKAELSLTGY